MKTRHLRKSVRRWLKRILSFFTPSKQATRGAAWGIIIVSVLLHFFGNAGYAGYIGYHYWAIFLLGLLLAALLGGLLFDLVAGWLANIPKIMKVAMAITLAVVMFSFSLNQQTIFLMLGVILLLASFTGAAFWLLYKGYWKTASVATKVAIVAAGIIGVMGLSWGTWWFIQPGKQVQPPFHAAMQNDPLPDHLLLPNPAKQGPYHVHAITYGSGMDKRRPEFGEKASLISHTVNGSPFLESWDGWTGKLRTRYFGFGKDSLPLNGRVWYPDKKEASPLVLIVHGNHLAQDFSDPGYAYLGELLASRGFIVVSVDQNFINGSFTNMMKSFGGENDARGWLLLKHLELWQVWSEETDHHFFGKVDMDRISLIGHSRGGEAVGHAALFNTLSHYPDDAAQTFSFGFGIRSVIAIAPVDGQYQPAGILTPISDVNFLVLQGSHDADMQSYHGQRQFKRVQFSEDFDGFKAGLYIYGANHGQFNSVWGRKDFFSPRINFFNIRQLISAEDQQTIAKITISAFLEATLNEKNDYRLLFMDHRYGRDWLPETIYLNQYQQAGTIFVARYEEDLDLTTTSLKGGRIETANLTKWKERVVPQKWGNLGTRAVYASWDKNKDNQDVQKEDQAKDQEEYEPEDDKTKDQVEHQVGHQIELQAGNQEEYEPAGNELKAAGTESSQDHTLNEEDIASYKIIVPEGSIPDVMNKALIFFLADGGEADEKTDQGIDFGIELADTDGYMVRFELSDHKSLQPAIKVNMGKLPFMSTAPGTEVVFDTFIFPVRSILENNSPADIGFSPEKMTSIRFVFDKTEKGTIILNDLGFMNWAAVDSGL